MFRQPVAVVTPPFYMLREIGGVAKSLRRVAAFKDRRQIEQRETLHLDDKIKRGLGSARL